MNHTGTQKLYLAKGIHQMFHPHKSHPFSEWVLLELRCVLEGVAATDPDVDEKVNEIGRRVGRRGAET